MYAGRLIEEGRTNEVLRDPMHPYTQHLVASLPQIGDLKPKTALNGAPPSLAQPPSGGRFHPRCPLATDICRQTNPDLSFVMRKLQARANRVASDSAAGNDCDQLRIGLPANICRQWTTRMEAAPTRRLSKTWRGAV